MTGTVCIASACAIPGTVASQISPLPPAPQGMIRIEHPQGVIIMTSTSISPAASRSCAARRWCARAPDIRRPRVRSGKGLDRRATHRSLATKGKIMASRGSPSVDPSRTPAPPSPASVRRPTVRMVRPFQRALPEPPHPVAFNKAYTIRETNRSVSFASTASGCAMKPAQVSVWRAE